MTRTLSRFTVGCAAGCFAIASALAPAGYAQQQQEQSPADPSPAEQQPAEQQPAEQQPAEQPNDDPAAQLDAAAEPASTGAEGAVPEGEPTQISDWALAGVVWSDAHLVRKLAQETGRRAESPPYQQRMAALVEDCDTLIASLETFGWKRIAAAEAAAPAASPGQPAPAEASQAPDIKSPGFAPPPENPLDAAIQARAEAQPRSGNLAQRVETETPAGTDDPGVDDELDLRMSNQEWRQARPFSLRRYRVDDHIDETSAEAANAPDAAEDGVEEALAAQSNAASEFGTEEAIGVMDRRRAQTQSSTLPYSANTIYDLDDVHPNAAYPAAAEVTVGPARGVRPGPLAQDAPGIRNVPETGQVVRGQNPSADEIIDPLPPTGEVDGATAPLDTGEPLDAEDEFIEEATQGDQSVRPEPPARPAARADAARADAARADAARADAARTAAPRIDVNRYTDEQARVAHDADWVEFRLAANQQRWLVLSRQLDQLTSMELAEHVNAAILQLQADAATASQASNNPQLAELLQGIAE